MSKSLSGRIAVITGASSGIGAETARALAARGASVALLARRKDKLEALAAELKAKGTEALVIEVDVTDKDAVERAAKEVNATFGRVDIVVNNAGVMLPNPIELKRDDQWKQQIDLNITGVMNVIGAFSNALLATGAEKRPADLINLGSIAGQNIFPYFAVYSATKAFVTHLSLTLRAELGPKGVRVSSIEPGIVGTELQSHVDFQGTRDWLESTKGQIEWLTPADVAEVIGFTVSLPAHVNLQQVTVMPSAQG